MLQICWEYFVGFSECWWYVGCMLALYSGYVNRASNTIFPHWTYYDPRVGLESFSVSPSLSDRSLSSSSLLFPSLSSSYSDGFIPAFLPDWQICTKHTWTWPALASPRRLYPIRVSQGQARIILFKDSIHT